MEWKEEFNNRFEERVKEWYLNEYKVVSIKFLHGTKDGIFFQVEENEQNIINYQSISVVPFFQFTLSYALGPLGNVYWNFSPTKYFGTKDIKFVLWKFESFAKIWEMVSKEDKKHQLDRFKTNTDSYKEFDLVYTSNLKIDEVNNKKNPNYNNTFTWGRTFRVC